MNVEKFNKFKVELEKMVEWNGTNILEMEIKLGKLAQNIISLMYTERVEYENMLTKKKNVYGKLYHHFKYKSDYAYDGKSEIESQIYTDDDFNTLLIDLNRQGAILEHMESTLKNIQSLPFQIRDYIKYKMFKEGLSYSGF